MTSSGHDPRVSERQAHAEATYERLFGPRDTTAADNDPELMEILRRFIFGDVFDTGVLDDQTRELITVTVLACLQTLPQLKSHTAAALNVGVQPIQIREAIYQLAPFIGFPRTLNAIATIAVIKSADDERRRRENRQDAEPLLLVGDAALSTATGGWGGPAPSISASAPSPRPVRWHQSPASDLSGVAKNLFLFAEVAGGRNHPRQLEKRRQWAS